MIQNKELLLKEIKSVRLGKLERKEKTNMIDSVIAKIENSEVLHNDEMAKILAGNGLKFFAKKVMQGDYDTIKVSETIEEGQPEAQA